MRWKRIAVLLLLGLASALAAACRVYESEEDQYQYERGGLPQGTYQEWDVDGVTTGRGH